MNDDQDVEAYDLGAEAFMDHNTFCPYGPLDPCRKLWLTGYISAEKISGMTFSGPAVTIEGAWQCPACGYQGAPDHFDRHRTRIEICPKCHRGRRTT